MKTLSKLQSEARKELLQRDPDTDFIESRIALAYQAGKDAVVDQIQQHASYKLEKVRRRNENVGGFEIISEKQYQIPEWVLEEARNTN